MINFDPVKSSRYTFAQLKYLEKLPTHIAIAANIPRAHWRNNFDGIADEETRSQIGHFMGEDNFVTNVLSGLSLKLTGSNGTGKTSIACLIAMEVLRRRGSAYFLLSHDIHGAVQRKNDESDSIINIITAVNLCVIDDLGAEFVSNNSDWGIRQVEAILRTRRERGLSTIVTTNLNEFEMQSNYGKRVAQSLIGFVDLQVEGTNQRKKAVIPVSEDFKKNGLKMGRGR